jgi:uncharacterized protein (DUF433 family)
MSLTIKKEQVPLKTDSDGVVRVGGTRVTLDTVMAAFKEGAAPEEIVYRYPSLRLADVYAVISYYLRRTREVENYLRQRQHYAEEVRKENQARFDLHGIRDRLLARQAKTG